LSQLTLRPAYQEELTNYLALIEDLERRIVAATKEIKRQLKPDPRAKLLMTLPAIGHLTAYLLLNEIGDIKRFPAPGKLCAYGGIVPIVRQSADHRWQGHITRAGNRYIRWALTEVACLAPSKDYALGNFYRRVAFRRGTMKARVAVARKLLVAVWYVLLSFAQVMDRLRHPHPSLPLKGEGIEGRGQRVSLLMRRSVTYEEPYKPTPFPKV